MVTPVEGKPDQQAVLRSAFVCAGFSFELHIVCALAPCLGCATVMLAAVAMPAQIIAMGIMVRRRILLFLHHMKMSAARPDSLLVHQG
jgi:hypothetical protein